MIKYLKTWKQALESQENELYSETKAQWYYRRKRTRKLARKAITQYNEIHGTSLSDDETIKRIEDKLANSL